MAAAALPAELIGMILLGLPPHAWGTVARVSRAFRASAALCWENMTELAVVVGADGRIRARFRWWQSAQIPTSEVPGGRSTERVPDAELDGEPGASDPAGGWCGCLDVAGREIGEISVAELSVLLQRFTRLQSLALRDLRLTGRLREGYSRHPGQDATDSVLALCVYLLTRCPHLQALSLLRCVGDAFDTAPSEQRVRSGQPPPCFGRLRSLQISEMDGPGTAGARWLVRCTPNLHLLDLSWSDANFGSLLELPRAIERIDLVGCLAVGEAQIRELVRSPEHGSLMHVSLPSGMPFSVVHTCLQLPRLRALECSGAYSDGGAPRIAIEHAELRALGLSALLLNHACCLELACPRLQRLDLRQDVFVFEGISGLSLACPELELLDVRWNAQLQLKVTAPMAELRSALLEGCAALSAHMLYNLVQSAPNLEQLEMGECDGLRVEQAVFALAFAYALRSRPRLRYILPSGVKGVGLDAEEW